MVTRVSTPNALLTQSSIAVLIAKKKKHHGTVKTLGSRRETLGRASPSLLRVVISHEYFIGKKHCHLCASARVRVKLLRGLWDCGRACGNRSVFVTLHRLARAPTACFLCTLISRACFQPSQTLVFAFEFILPTIRHVAPPNIWIWNLLRF